MLGNRTQKKKNWETNGLTSHFNSHDYKVHINEVLIYPPRLLVVHFKINPETENKQNHSCY